MRCSRGEMGWFCSSGMNGSDSRKTPGPMGSTRKKLSLSVKFVPTWRLFLQRWGGITGPQLLVCCCGFLSSSFRHFDLLGLREFPVHGEHHQSLVPGKRGGRSREVGKWAVQEAMQEAARSSSQASGGMEFTWRTMVFCCGLLLGTFWRTTVVRCFSERNVRL